MFKKALRILVCASALYGAVIVASKIQQKMKLKKEGGNPKDVKWLK
jgi:hypothetical protein